MKTVGELVVRYVGECIKPCWWSYMLLIFSKPSTNLISVAISVHNLDGILLELVLWFRVSSAVTFRNVAVVVVVANQFSFKAQINLVEAVIFPVSKILFERALAISCDCKQSWAQDFACMIGSDQECQQSRSCSQFLRTSGNCPVLLRVLQQTSNIAVQKYLRESMFFKSGLSIIFCHYLKY